MARRVYLHIGTMKSGTSYLQQLFNANRQRLAASGILCLHSARNHSAVQALARSRRAGEAAAGAWDELCRRVGDHDGDALVSTELMAPFSTGRIKQVGQGLAAPEMRVIITARDLTRVLPSQWQETTQNQGTKSWREYVESVCVGPESRSGGVRFWRQHDLPRVIARWSHVASPGQVHLVTVPRDTSDPLELWRRFSRALASAPTEVDDVQVSNPSLGGVSAELMRRVNVHVGDVEFPDYRPGFKHALAKRILMARAEREPKPRLSQEQYERVRELASSMVDELRELPVEVSRVDRRSPSGRMVR